MQSVDKSNPFYQLQNKKNALLSNFTFKGVFKYTVAFLKGSKSLSSGAVNVNLTIIHIKIGQSVTIVIYSKDFRGMITILSFLEKQIYYPIFLSV
jgi:hypothetical protein